MTGKVYENGCVLIENGKIKEVGEELTASFGEEIIDARGGWVLPGLVDAHSHLGTHEANMGFEGNDTNEITDPITPQLRVIDGLNPQDKAFEAVRASGVTTTLVAPGSANVIGGQCAVIKTYGRCVDEMVIVEPAAVKIAFGENPKRYTKNSRKCLQPAWLSQASCGRPYMRPKLIKSGRKKLQRGKSTLLWTLN